MIRITSRRTRALAALAAAGVAATFVGGGVALASSRHDDPVEVRDVGDVRNGRGADDLGTSSNTSNPTVAPSPPAPVVAGPTTPQATAPDDSGTTMPTTPTVPTVSDDEPGDDHGGQVLEPGDDHGAPEVEPGDDHSGPGRGAESDVDHSGPGRGSDERSGSDHSGSDG